MADLGADPGAQLAIDSRLDPSGAAVMTVSGELDTSTAASLEAATSAAAAANPERLIFDLSGLRFMDSAGIAVLVGAAAKVAVVQLRNPSDAVRRVIELTGLTGVLPMDS